MAVLNKAISPHRGGELEAAGRLYRRVVETQPKNAEPLRLLGVAVTPSGRPERGLFSLVTAYRLVRQSSIEVTPPTECGMREIGTSGSEGEAPNRQEDVSRRPHPTPIPHV